MKRKLQSNLRIHFPWENFALEDRRWIQALFVKARRRIMEGENLTNEAE
jgi:hypothetical protein